MCHRRKTTRSAGPIDVLSGVSWVPYTDAEPFHGQVMQLDASPVPYDGEIMPGEVVGLGWFCPKDIREEDRVEFDSEIVDGYGMPAMRIHYDLTDNDRRTIARAKDEIIAVGDLLGDAEFGAPIEFPAGASLHYQGTTRMGETDDGRSVCDENSQVWGYPGLLCRRKRCHTDRDGMQPHAHRRRARHTRSTRDREQPERRTQSESEERTACLSERSSRTAASRT